MSSISLCTKVAVFELALPELGLPLFEDAAINIDNITIRGILSRERNNVAAQHISTHTMKHLFA